MSGAMTRFELVLLDGSGRRFPLPLSGEVLVGSAVECAVRLTAGDVSRRHALLRVSRGVVGVVDLGSKNGTFVGGERVREAVLKAGDLVRFSSVMAQVVPLGAPSEAGVEPVQAGEGSTGSRELTPSREIAAVTDGSGLEWLLERWGREGVNATVVTLEWIRQQAGVRGAALLRCSGEERVVLGAVGEVEKILASGAFVASLGELVSYPGGLETVPMEVGDESVLAVRCGAHHCLVVLLGRSNLSAAQMKIFAHAVFVACRLDG